MQSDRGECIVIGRHGIVLAALDRCFAFNKMVQANKGRRGRRPLHSTGDNGAANGPSGTTVPTVEKKTGPLCYPSLRCFSG